MLDNVLISADAWNKVLFADRFYLEHQPRPNLERLRKSYLTDFLGSTYTFPDYLEGDVVFIRSLVRADYRDLFHIVMDQSGVEAPVVIEDYKARLEPGRINHRASQFFLNNQQLFTLPRTDDPLMRSILFMRAAMYAYILDHFRRRPKPRAVVFFADMQPTEHLLALYFRGLGVPTVTMQHGLYVDYGDHDTVNTINYLHQPSEYFLSWGPDSSKLIARHHPDTKIIECGKPLIFNASPDKGHKGDGKPYVALLLDQKPFHQQNEEMITLVLAWAQARGLAVTARFHPSLPKAQILAKFPRLREQLHFCDAQVVVGHTTSMIYEALALGCRVMRYASPAIPAISLPEKYEFSTEAEFGERVELPQDPELWKNYFTATGEAALPRYKAFFKKLLGGKPHHG